MPGEELPGGPEVSVMKPLLVEPLPIFYDAAARKSAGLGLAVLGRSRVLLENMTGCLKK